MSNMMFFYSNKSMNILNTVDPLLKTLALNVLKYSNIDIAIVDGIRTVEQQQKLYKRGVSFCDGIKNKSKHQDGLAFDFTCFIDGKPTYDIKYYYYVVALMESEARKLGIKIKCGIWFKDKNGNPFEDGGHIEKAKKNNCG